MAYLCFWPGMSARIFLYGTSPAQPRGTAMDLGPRQNPPRRDAPLGLRPPRRPRPPRRLDRHGRLHLPAPFRPLRAARVLLAKPRHRRAAAHENAHRRAVAPRLSGAAAGTPASATSSSSSSFFRSPVASAPPPPRFSPSPSPASSTSSSSPSPPAPATACPRSTLRCKAPASCSNARASATACGLTRRWRGRLFAIGVVTLPIAALFPPVFVTTVMVPFFHLILALP